MTTCSLDSRLTIALAGLVLIGLTGCGRPSKETADHAPLPSVQLVSASKSTLAESLPATGTLSPLPGREATLSPQVSGTLLTLTARFGAKVRAGQVIAQISTAQLQGQIQQAQATLGQNLIQVQQAEANAMQQSAQTSSAISQATASLRNAQAGLAAARATLAGDLAALHNAQQALTRAQTLFTDGLVAQKDVEAAQLSVQTAQSQVDAQRQTVVGQQEIVDGQANAVAAARTGVLQNIVKQKDIEVARQQVDNARGALATSRAQLSLYTLKAPLSGRITALGASAGESVDTATKLVTISDLNVLQLQIGVPSASARKVHPGQPVAFTVDALPGRTFHTVVETVSPQVDTTSGTVPVLALVTNAAGLLKDDMTVAAQITIATKSAVVTVPQAAVLTDPDSGQTTVDIVGPDDVLHVTPVKLGLRARGQVEIVSGLDPGVHVIVSGQYGLPDGAKISAGSASDGS